MLLIIYSDSTYSIQLGTVSSIKKRKSMWGSLQSLFFPENSVVDKKGPVLEVTLDNCIQKFDERLFPIVWFELREVLSILKKINEIQQVMIELSVECRMNVFSSSVSQNNRLHKMCEMMESIPLVPYPSSYPVDFIEGLGGLKLAMASSSLSSVPLLCPDLEILTAYIAKIRSKLKLIEDMAASKKSDNIRFKYKGGTSTASMLAKKLYVEQIYDCGFVRSECKIFSTFLEELETAFHQYSFTMQHLTTIKYKLHRPFLELQSLFSQLPSLVSAEQLVLDTKQDFEQAEVDYQEHRNHNPVLLEVTGLQQELQRVSQDIESFLSSYLSCVSQFASPSSPSPSSDEDIRQLLACLTKVFTKCAEESTDQPGGVMTEEDRDILRLLFLEPLLVHWQRTLRKHNQQQSHLAPPSTAAASKLTAETLTAVFLKRSVEDLESIILQFHRSVLEVALQSPAAAGSSSSSSSSSKPPSQSSRPQHHQQHHQQQQFSPRPSVQSIADVWMETLPIDELLSLHQRFRHTQDLLAVKTGSTAFEEAVTRLQTLRSTSRQQLLQCQQSGQRYRHLLTVHANATSKLRQFVDSYVQVVKEELQLQVEFRGAGTATGV